MYTYHGTVPQAKSVYQICVNVTSSRNLSTVFWSYIECLKNKRTESFTRGSKEAKLISV